MIIPDVNLLLYAYRTAMPQHDRARQWWEATLTNEPSVGLPWAVVTGYVRISTHRRFVDPPLSAAVAIADVRAWLQRPNVGIVEPGPRHLELLERLLADAGTAGALTTDAHLAAIAIEHQAELHSHDTDFARFPGLQWHDPLA